MNINQEELATNHLKLIVRVEPVDYLGQVDLEIKSLSRKVSIDGFRPGKVPEGITRKLYGNSVLAETLNKIVTESLDRHIKEHHLRLLGQPLPLQVTDQQIDLAQPVPLSFGFELGLIPEVILPELAGRVFKRKVLEVTPEMVDNEVKRILMKGGERSYPEFAAGNDTLNGKWQELDESGGPKSGGTEAVSSFSLEAIRDPVAKEVFMQLQAGQSTDLNIMSAFGDNRELVIHHILQTDHDTADRMNQRFRFTLNKIIHVEPATADQQFFDDYFGPGLVSSEDEMKQRIRELLQEEFERASVSRLDREIQNVLIAESSIPLPEAFLHRWMADQEQEPVTDEQMAATLNQFRWELLHNEIVKTQHLECTEEELRQEAGKEVMRYFNFTEPLTGEQEKITRELVSRVLTEEKSSARLRNQVLNEKVFNWLRSQVQTEEMKVGEHEFFHH